MNKIERIKMLKAMEYLARHVNNEDIFDSWLSEGVADGGIQSGDLSVNADDPENLEYYLEDAEFADLMRLFCYLISEAFEDGGIYCDSVLSSGGGQ